MHSIIPPTRRRLALCLVLLAAAPGAALAATADVEASIIRKADTWTLSTGSVEKTVALADGNFTLKSLRAKASSEQLATTDYPSGEFAATIDRQRVTGSSGGWKLADAKEARLAQGERELDLTLDRGPLRVTKTYVIYPGSSVIREWCKFTNIGSAPLQVADPDFLLVNVATAKPDDQQFHWMTGGENQPGSWVLKTEKLVGDKARRFDSNDPFPTSPQAPTNAPGDGVDVRIDLNDRAIWPAQPWQYIADATVTVPFDVATDVKPGDRIIFRVNMHGNIGYDTTAFDPTISYGDGETHTASKEFSDQQGKNGWRYQYIENGKFVDLVYYPGPRQWRKEKDNPTGTPFVGAFDQHPDAMQDAVRVWTASRAGKVRITGAACNTGNHPGGGGGLRAGTASYAPWYALYHPDTRGGLFIGFDYFGHWTSSFARAGDATAVSLTVAGFKQALASGQSITTPKAFVGLFRDDLDNAGNECLDWQYRYLWDYTREKEGWFPAIRMLGYWMKGTGWGKPGVAWTGGDPDLLSTFRKVFRVADLMRDVGADVYHRDWGWWDRAGDWNGPDFHATGDYLRKSGMGQLIYAFLYTVDPASRVAKEHPDWVLGGTLDMSRPEVVSFIGGQLNDFARRWGDFEWRNDSLFTAPKGGDETVVLGQDEGFRQVIASFLDRHPRSAFQAVNGGGNYVGYDYTRYASAVSFSDGAVGIQRNYHAALMLPPDKTSDIPDNWNPDNYDKATWRGLLCINFDMTGDTADPAKLEGIRQLVDIYHYLHSQGVVGRWVHVYRPRVSDDDATMYFQRLSADSKRGIIIPKRPAPRAVMIFPKGLLPDAMYTVNYQESDAAESRTGAQLMSEGISIAKMPAGELIYLNLPLHPGSRLDKTPPTPPSDAHLAAADNMGFPGVELTWKPGGDDNWVSYYDIFRDGASIDRVARGTYYFDHSAGADLAATYEVCTVDGGGNASARLKFPRSADNPAQVIDDAAGAAKYTGSWEHLTGIAPAHLKSLSRAKDKSASVEIPFNGKRVLLFGKLGADCGSASVSIDNGPPEPIDTYDADDIWGACVYRKQLSAAGPHTLRLTLTGEHNVRSSGSVVYFDGVRAE